MIDMSMVHLTAARVNELLDEAVEEKGADYVYPFASTPDEPGQCVNAIRGIDGTLHPSCIVGNVMHRAGVPLEVLYREASANVDVLINELDLDVDDTALKLLGTAQGLQDTGTPWGAAVEAARRAAKEGAQ